MWRGRFIQTVLSSRACPWGQQSLSHQTTDWLVASFSDHLLTYLHWSLGPGTTTTMIVGKDWKRNRGQRAKGNIERRRGCWNRTWEFMVAGKVKHSIWHSTSAIKRSRASPTLLIHMKHCVTSISKWCDHQVPTATSQLPCGSMHCRKKLEGTLAAPWTEHLLYEKEAFRENRGKEHEKGELLFTTSSLPSFLQMMHPFVLPFSAFAEMATFGSNL